MLIKYPNLIISENMSLSEAMHKMDETRHKLLILLNSENKYVGLITIGDIQRAIIAGNSLDSDVKRFVRSDLVIARTSYNVDDIRRQMIRLRIEYMPVINDDNELDNIIFWEEIIDSESRSKKSNLNLPVVIMAGGLGTRLKPLTNILPKPLLPLNEKSILENIIERFEEYGCNQFLVSVNYKASLIQYYLDNIPSKTYQIELYLEDKPLGTAGSLSLLKNKLNSSFFVSNCDILIDEDYGEIYDYHKKNDNELTIVVSLRNYKIPYGTIESGSNGELLTIVEKPNLNFLINCGMYILEPHLLQEIPEDRFYHLTDLIDQIKNRGGKVGVFPISEKSLLDIGEWELYLKQLKKNSYKQ